MRVLSILFVGLAATSAWADPAFERVDLVSDGAVPAAHTDANLVNPWGLAAGPTTPWWVADNGTNVSTLYNATGVPLALVVTTQEAPTGLVFNGNNEFIVSDGMGHSGAARFIFAAESGSIAAWSPAVPPPAPSRMAFIVYDGSAQNKVYKGLAIARTCDGEARLYATDFHNGHVDVFNDEFKLLKLGEDAFDDDHLPRGYAPFGIAVIDERVFVTYALQNAERHDDVAGPGHGFIDEYDRDGRFIRRVASRGALNSPWGLAIAPHSFGRFGGDLLVGNFGDGRINVYEHEHGRFHFEGTISDKQGKPIVTDGLWSIAPGNDSAAGSSRDLYFTAGINGEADGLFGLIRRAW